MAASPGRQGRFFGGTSGVKRWSGPLVLRVGLCLAVIAGLALFTMVASMVIADTAKDDAAAINKAGSLRMQSYHMLYLWQREEEAALEAAVRRFETALQDSAIAKALPPAHHPLSQRYQGIRAHWQETMRPRLEAGQEGVPGAVETFVRELDGVVNGMQQQAETRIQILRLIQGAAIFITLGVVSGTMYLLHTGVVSPLRDLRRAADQARKGDLDARVSHVGDDELGSMGRTFNTMAESIQEMHRELEREVRHTTRDLRRSNDALGLLYRTARSLTPDGPPADALQDTVDRLRGIMNCDQVTLCLSDTGSEHAYRSFISSRGPPPAFCRPPDRCVVCLAHVGREAVMPPGTTSFPLLEQGHRHGVLLVQYPRDRRPEDWKMRLAEAIAGQIATALARAGQAREQRQLVLMEERAIIARELHDSLAQSLSYLKIQVTRLQTLRQRKQPEERMDEVITDLREGLNEAYTHLRELLANFRLSVSEAGLPAALQATVEEFGHRGNLPIRLQLQLGGAPLDTNAEIHLLHITREALTNVVNHAGATEASVTLRSTPGGRLELIVEDDGTGIPEEFERLHHYGTRIMRERALQLGGRCTISNGANGGTRVRVHCTARERAEARREPAGAGA